MKRFVLFILIVLCFVLSACSHADYTITADSNKTESTESDTGKILYVVNTSTRTYHLPDCYILDRTKEENTEETYDTNFLTNREYTPCKICIANEE